MTLPGLARDVVVIKRPGATVDAEGNPVEALATVSTTTGTWGSPSYQDLNRAAQLGMVIDAVIAMPTSDVRLGDIVTVRSKDYRAVAIADTRTHQRVFLRRAE